MCVGCVFCIILSVFQLTTAVVMNFNRRETCIKCPSKCKNISHRISKMLIFELQNM